MPRAAGLSVERFRGAGKTTTLGRVARRYQYQGLEKARVDQVGSLIVDDDADLLDEPGVPAMPLAVWHSI